MSALLDSLSDDERKIRKYWLYLTTFWYFSPLIVTLYKADANNGFISALAYFITYLIINGIFFLWIHHCACKKHGTILLTIFLSLTTLGSFLLLLTFANLAASNPFPFSFTILFFLNFSASVCWVILSIKLRKINKKLQDFMSIPTNHDS